MIISYISFTVMVVKSWLSSSIPFYIFYSLCSTQKSFIVPHVCLSFFLFFVFCSVGCWYTWDLSYVLPRSFLLWRAGSDLMVFLISLFAPMEYGFLTTVSSGKSSLFILVFTCTQYINLVVPFFSLSNLCSFLYMYSVQLPLNMGHLILTGTL